MRMKQKQTIRQRRHGRGLILSLLLLTLSLPGRAVDYINMEYAYQAMQMENGKIHLRCMFDDWGGSHYYVKEATLYAIYDDNQKVYIGRFESGSNVSDADYYTNIGNNNKATYNDNKYQNTSLWVGVDSDLGGLAEGYLTVTNGYNGAISGYSNTFYGQSTYKLDKGRYACWVDNTSKSGQVFVEMDWHYPTKLADKKFRIFVAYKCAGASDAPNRQMGDVFTGTSIEQPITLVPAYVSTDAERVNQMEVRYMLLKDFKSLKYYYDGGDGTLPTDSKNGTFYLKADQEYKNLYLQGDYYYSDRTTVTTTSEKMDVKAIRPIKNLKATTVQDRRGSVMLTWQLDNPSGEDAISAIDMFEIQRATQRDFSDAKAVTTILIEKDKGDYSYKDSTDLFMQIGSNYYNQRTRQQIYYRIRREQTSLWGWKCSQEARIDRDLSVAIGTASKVTVPDDFEDTHRLQIDIAPYNDTICYDRYGNPQAIAVRDPKAGYYLEYETQQYLGNWTYTEWETHQENLSDEIAEKLNDANNTDTVSFYFTLSQPCTRIRPTAIRARTALGVRGEGVGLDYRVYSYEEGAKMKKLSVSKGFYNDYNYLTWETSTDDYNYFFIKRREVTKEGDTGDWQLLVTNLQQKFYKDTDIDPRKFYEYQVFLAYQCGNQAFRRDSSNVDLGFVRSVGTVEGYIRYADGTAVPNTELTVDTPDGISSGRSLYFRHNLMYAHIACTNEAIAIPDRWTVQMYVQNDDTEDTTPRTLMRWGDYRIDILDGRPYLSIGDETPLVQASAIPTGEFHHLSVSVDAATDSVWFYIDGKPDTAGTLSRKNTQGQDLVIMGGQPQCKTVMGVEYYTMEYSFQGYIDEVRLWSKTLTADEIADNYRRFLSGKEVGLTAYWRFDEEMPHKNQSYAGTFIDWAGIGTTDTKRHNGRTYYWNGSRTAFVNATSSHIPSQAQLWFKGMTNGSGYYRITGLPIVGESTYTLTPVSPSGQKFSPAGGLSVTLDLSNKTKSNINFTITSSYEFSGTVLYEGSSIPVRDVQFLLNGEVVRNSAGIAITTDEEGEFSFYVPRGANTIQVVKDGHTFLNDGYLLNDEGQPVREFEKQLQGIRFWDTTKVKLMGRLVGGTVQGGQPLGRSLSRNNLGDSLRIVLQLEGDNKSWIVKDQLNDDIKTRTEHFDHLNEAHGNDVISERHRITIKPDETTGEYVALLYPVKYKVVEASATGYVTLFQDGMVSEVLDLSDSVRVWRDEATYEKDGQSVTDVVEYGARYDRIYRAPIQLTFQQVNEQGEDYFGSTQYESANLIGVKETIPLYDKESGRYLFGHPVFEKGLYYVFLASAHEDYHYNNKTGGLLDQVATGAGAQLQVHNGFSTNATGSTYELDSLGQCLVGISVGNVSYNMTGADALQRFSMTAVIDETPIESDILEAYIMGAKEDEAGKQIIAGEKAQLFDILRDPPGANSSAWLEAGSTYKYSYHWEWGWKAGVQFNFSLGSGSTNYQGVISGGVVEAGVINETSKEHTLGIDATLGYGTTTDYTYTFTANQRIETSSDPFMVGADADIYIGGMQSIAITPVISVRVINETMYKQLQGGESTGSLLVIDQATDADGKTYYLVRSEAVSLDAPFVSTFTYTGDHIEHNLIPDLIKRRNATLFTGTLAEAQELANKRGSVVYWSMRQAGDEGFGNWNMNGQNLVRGNTQTTGNWSYALVKPSGMEDYSFNDSIYDYNETIATWIRFLALNEKEKVEVENDKLIGNYNVSGNAALSYSEEYEGEQDSYRYFQTPGLFDISSSGFGGDVLGEIVKAIKHGPKGGVDSLKVSFSGVEFSVGIKPVAEINVEKPSNAAQTLSYTRQTGFNLDMEFYSNMSIDVYRKKAQTYSEEDAAITNDLFWKKDYQSFVEKIISEQSDNYFVKFVDKDKIDRYGSLVYRVRGGATRCPFEDEYKPRFYNSDKVINERTLRIENPRIQVEEASVSNVPSDKPAVFHLQLMNEGEYVNHADSLFHIALVDGSNPHGAKLTIDGAPLTAAARPIYLSTTRPTNKVLEVRCGEGYDFEDLAIVLRSECDIYTCDTVRFSAHFLPSAGDIHVSTPSDKWLMNTESAYDKGYYMPVRIDGFDVNHRGFDHIELQYKISTKGEKDWTNLCSYYADSTRYAAANGTRAMIGDDGYIEARFFGEKDPIEQQYDLRAVTYCRYGNGFITSSSPILTGIKDTRRPAPFGNVEPANGVLTVNDNIRIAFSEDIAVNYLSKVNHLDVTGHTTSSEITQSTSLHFTDNTYARTAVKRNLTGKDLTIEMLIKPASTGKTMTLFSHLCETDTLLFQLTADNRLQACINGQTFATKNPLTFGGFRQVALTIDAETHQVCFYQGNQLLESTAGEAPDYNGMAPLLFGGTSVKYGEVTDPYVGNMLEARLWNTVLTPSELSQFGFKRLTGYEPGLLDYYPMNEGTGTYLYDLAQGATATLNQASWTLPDGLSLRLDGVRDGVKLEERFFARTERQDYTLMFWFKTDTRGRGTLLANGYGSPDEVNPKNKFFIGFEGKNLVYRSNGFEEIIPGDYSDNKWHHYAMTVNRTRNVGNIYMDNTLCSTFAIDTLGGISSNRLYLGASYYNRGTMTTVENKLTGNIDDLSFWETAMPANVINDYYNISPEGDELGLLAYLPFSKNEKQMDNSYKLTFTTESMKRYIDQSGNYTNQVDTLIREDVSTLADKTDFAPVRDLGVKENIKFSFTAKDNELIINLDEPDKYIENTTVYVTVKDIPDLNGNEMESPVMMSVYVNRNDLVWAEKALEITSDAYWSEDYIRIQNKGGQKHSYTIEGMPEWMTVTPSAGHIDALDETLITIRINQNINVGTYDEVLYLVNDNGVAEPLAVTVKVPGQKPGWTCDKRNFDMSMNLCARLYVNDRISTDEADLVGVFNGNTCVGTAHISYDTQTGQSYVYLSVYGNAEDDGTAPLTFYAWDASTGITYQALPRDMEGIVFKDGTLVGTADKPVLLDAGSIIQQQFALDEGWNWISFNVYNQGFNDVEKILPLLKAKNGDQVKDPTHSAVMSYKNDEWIYNKPIAFDNAHMYQVYDNEEKNVQIPGYLLKDDRRRTVSLVPGWNYIGYAANINLTLKEALADYADQALDGDLIKSQDEFAIFTVGGQGTRQWKGNLTYMRPGEGYMLFRNAAKGTSAAAFTYPYIEPNSGYYARARRSIRKAAGEEPLFSNRQSGTMTLTARTIGICLQAGDVLAAYDGDELRGMAQVDEADSLFYLSIGGDADTDLRYVLLRNGKPTAYAKAGPAYRNHARIGSPEAPTTLYFDEGTTAYGIAPNPFAAYVDFCIPTREGDRVEIRILAVDGTLVDHCSLTATTDATTFRWNGGAGLAAGAYVAEVDVNGTTNVFKLMKQ